MIILALLGGLLGAAVLMYFNGVEIKHLVVMTVLNHALILYFAYIGHMLINGFGTYGVNSSGGAVGLILGVLFYSKLYPQFKEIMINAYGLVCPYMYGVGKIGCAFSGCCGGRSYSGPFAIQRAAGDVFPVQAVEAVVFLLIFAIGLALFVKKNYDLFVMAMICGGAKILLDFLRDTHGEQIISVNQIICFGVMIALFTLRRIFGFGVKADEI